MPSILWFRRDLRLHDNPALVEAANAGQDAGGVVGLFVLDDALLARAGAPRIAYLLDSLRSLDSSLDGNLTILRGDPATAVAALSREVDAPSVHVAADFTPYGRRRDDAVEHALATHEVPLLRTGSPYAVAPGRLRTGSGTPFRVFTPFRRAWLDHGWRRPAPDADARWVAPGAERGVDALPASPDLGETRLPPAGEQAARRRWAAFRDGPLAEYAEGRDRPDLPGTSRLSAALKFGEVHPRTLLADLADAIAAGRDATGVGGAGAGAGAAAETFRSELCWREFYADVLFHTPSSATTSMRTVVAEDAWVAGDAEAERLRAWAQGRTGYPFVDAGMRQLLAEGWMHNRVRMVVASFLVKDLAVRWQRGADHFMHHLVDGDVASNQHNWQWVAGTGTDAAPYFRIFNAVRQGLRFDPSGDYVRRYVPELAAVPGAAVHEPWRLPGGVPAGYPERMVDHDVERRRALADHAARTEGTAVTKGTTATVTEGVTARPRTRGRTRPPASP